MARIHLFDPAAGRRDAGFSGGGARCRARGAPAKPPVVENGELAEIDLFYFDAGGGHRAAATALRTVIAGEGRPWRLRLVNLQELFDPIDILRRTTGMRIQDLYNLMLRRNWTLGAGALLKLFHGVVRLYHPAQLRLLEEFWSRRRPDMVVSVIPHFNRALYEAYRKLHPGGRFVTILTDLADYPPHLWIEPQDQWVICGTPQAAAQARRIGVPSGKIRLVSGMILRPEFYEEPDIDPAAERRRLGLEPERPTGLLLFGGLGSNLMVRVVRQLEAAALPVQLIAVCGRNPALAAALRKTAGKLPLHVVEYTDRIPYYMRLADFFIGKPGPGSLSEAAAMKLAVIVERNAWTLPQERFNTDWVREQGFGLVVGSLRREVVAAVRRLLEPGELERLRRAAARIENRAVFEIPGILAEILDSAGG